MQIVFNGRPHEVSGKTISDLVVELSLPIRGIAIAKNGEIVRRSEWDACVISTLDKIEVVTAAAGG